MAPTAEGDVDSVVRRHRDVLDRASARLKDRQPFFIGPEGLVDVRINRWFDSDEMRGLSSATWRKYAYSLRTWLNFLIVFGARWDDTASTAQEAFKVWRLMDERNPRRVSAGTYRHDLIALQLFYVWAADEFGVSNPIRMRAGAVDRRTWVRRGVGSGRPVTAPAAVRDRDVKWFDPAGFERYRDLGLMGLDTAGGDRPGVRARNGQRDGAFADGLYGTGVRLQEWGSVLLGGATGRRPVPSVHDMQTCVCDCEIRTWTPVLDAAFGLVCGTRLCRGGAGDGGAPCSAFRQV